MSAKSKPQTIQKPIGIVMQPYQSQGTGDSVPAIIGMKGLREGYDVVTISLYRQYVGIPILSIHTGRMYASHI